MSAHNHRRLRPLLLVVVPSLAVLAVLLLWLWGGRYVTTENASHVAKAVIDGHVRRMNGFGRLRWGRAFAAVEIAGLRTVDSDGRETQMVFPGSIHGHLPWDQYADMVEKLGSPRPDKPVGLDTIATALSEEPETIEDVYEPFLMQSGFIQRTSRGRTATALAYRHLGLEPPGPTVQQTSLL